MPEQSVFSIRLRNARIMKGYSMDDLCEKMGNQVSKMTISKYEKGITKPDDKILKTLSNILEQPLDYFSRPIRVHIGSVEFRKKSGLGIRQIETIKEIITDKLERYIDIEEICNEFRSPKDLPHYPVTTREQVVEAAIKLREKWNLGSVGITNVIELLEENGVKVVEVDAPPTFDGLGSKVNDEIPVIVLRKDVIPERKRFNALHELGHLVLDFNGDKDSKMKESFCHLFASEMLIPTQELKRILGTARKKVSYKEIIPLQERYGISYDALMYKASECGIISGQCFRWFSIHKNQDPSYKAFVQQNRYPIEETSNRFESLVHKALFCDLIDMDKAATLLGVSPESIRNEFTMV